MLQFVEHRPRINHESLVNTKVLINSVKTFEHGGIYTSNVEYREVM